MSSAPAYEDVPLGSMAPGQPGVPKGYHAGDSGPRGIDFFKPKNGFKIFNRVIFGVAVLLMVGMISLGVAFGVERAHYNQLKAMLLTGSDPTGSDPILGGTPPPACPSQTSFPATPLTGLMGLALWNSTDCTTPNGNCTAVLDIPQVNECFQLVWGVCHAEYNATHTHPLKNDTIFVNNPQCNHVIFQMYCEWESDAHSSIPCPAMVNFCADEFIELPAAATSINTSGLALVTASTTLTLGNFTTIGTVTTFIPLETIALTGTLLAIPTAAPTVKAAAPLQTGGSSYD